MVTDSETPITRELPWTHSCFVCGEDNAHGMQLKARVRDDGAVEMEHTARPSDAGWRDVMHGGLTMTLLDEVMTWAAILALKRGCVSAEFTTRLKAPVQVGQRIRVSGTVTRARGRLALVEGEAVGDDGTIFATATGKYMPVSEDMQEAFVKDFVVGEGVPGMPWGAVNSEQ